jgi:hypothetical protein
MRRDAGPFPNPYAHPYSFSHALTDAYANPRSHSYTIADVNAAADRIANACCHTIADALDHADPGTEPRHCDEHPRSRPR